MSLMANPMLALADYQRVVSSGMELDPAEFDGEYLKRRGEIAKGVTRYDYVKIIDREVQALAMFPQEKLFNSVPVYSVGYAVCENRRGKGLAVEAVTTGIEDLKVILGRSGIKKFYVEALIDKTNSYSIKVAEKIFSTSGTPHTDDETGIPALLFYKLIQTV